MPGLTVFSPASNDTAGILVAAYAAYQNGGGIVQLPSAQITLTASLPLYSGVKYVGSTPSLTYPVNPPDSQFAYAGGTRLIGDGTFPCFSANNTDRGSPNTIFGSDAISDAYVENMVISGFSHGIKCGAVNAIGLIHGGLRNLWIENCTQWGVFMANFMHSDIQRIWTQNCRNGQYYAALVDASVLMPGNSKMHTLFNIVPSAGAVCPDPLLHRGLVFESGGVSAKLNEIDAQRLQCNAFTRTQRSVTATLTSSSTSIGVPDSTLWPVGLPVSFTSTANGFTAGQAYFVLSSASNVITLGNSRTGSAISATGSGSMTLTTRGFPNLEISSLNTGAGVQNSWFTVDAEGVSSSGVYLENAAANRVVLSECPSPSNCDSTIIGRNATNSEYTSKNTVTIDLDGNSASSYTNGLPISAIRNVPPIGIIYDSTLTRNALTLSRFGATIGSSFTLMNRSPGNGDFTYPGLPMGQAAYVSTSTSLNFNVGQKAGVAVYTGTGAATWTWAQNAGTDMVGYMLTVKNMGTGTLTFALGGSGNGNLDGLAGHTSLTLNAPTGTTPGGVAVLYCYANGAWAVLNLSNGAIV